MRQYRSHGLVNGVVGADKKISAARGELAGRFEHPFRYALPISAVDAIHIVGERMGVERHFGMGMRSHPLGTFHANRTVAESCAFGGAANDSNVLRHAPILQSKDLRLVRTLCRMETAIQRNFWRLVQIAPSRSSSR